MNATIRVHPEGVGMWFSAPGSNTLQKYADTDPFPVDVNAATFSPADVDVFFCLALIPLAPENWRMPPSAVPDDEYVTDGAVSDPSAIRYAME